MEQSIGVVAALLNGNALIWASIKERQIEDHMADKVQTLIEAELLLWTGTNLSITRGNTIWRGRYRFELVTRTVLISELHGQVRS